MCTQDPYRLPLPDTNVLCLPDTSSQVALATITKDLGTPDAPPVGDAAIPDSGVRGHDTPDADMSSDLVESSRDNVPAHAPDARNSTPIKLNPQQLQALRNKIQKEKKQKK